MTALVLSVTLVECRAGIDMAAGRYAPLSARMITRDGIMYRLSKSSTSWSSPKRAIAQSAIVAPSFFAPIADAIRRDDMLQKANLSRARDSASAATDNHLVVDTDTLTWNFATAFAPSQIAPQSLEIARLFNTAETELDASDWHDVETAPFSPEDICAGIAAHAKV